MKNLFLTIIFSFLLFNPKSHSMNEADLMNSYIRCSVYFEVAIGSIRIANQNLNSKIEIESIEFTKKKNDEKMFELAKSLNIQIGEVYQAINIIRNQHAYENQRLSQFSEYSKKHRRFCMALVK